ncbi:MAG: NYN domain-containing protein [Thermomicrobiales bacterium]|nr:NYN domain-containing protein [Thermomicrobiales bacterium]
MMEKSVRPRANVYVDGFNVYFGCFRNPSRLEWQQYKWLDLAAFISKIYPHFDINRIRYFTAEVIEDSSDPNQLVRQRTYIRALETIPNLSVHKGRHYRTAKWKVLADPDSRQPVAKLPVSTAKVLIDEEKGSDVKLATYLLCDGYENEYDVAIVVSNDSDLAEPIELVRTRLNKRVSLLNPRKRTAFDLLNIADDYRSVRLGPIKSSQFSHQLQDANGTITIPEDWLPPNPV